MLNPSASRCVLRLLMVIGNLRLVCICVLMALLDKIEQEDVCLNVRWGSMLMCI